MVAPSTMIYTTMTWRGMHGWQSLPVGLHLRLAITTLPGLIRPIADFGSLVAMTALAATEMIYITMTCRPMNGWKSLPGAPVALSLPVALHPAPAMSTVVPGIQRTNAFGSLEALSVESEGQMIYITMTYRPIRGCKSLPMAMHLRLAMANVPSGMTQAAACGSLQAILTPAL